jgi:hypothetical protein
VSCFAGCRRWGKPLEGCCSCYGSSEDGRDQKGLINQLNVWAEADNLDDEGNLAINQGDGEGGGHTPLLQSLEGKPFEGCCGCCGTWKDDRSQAG